MIKLELLKIKIGSSFILPIMPDFHCLGTHLISLHIDMNMWFRVAAARKVNNARDRKTHNFLLLRGKTERGALHAPLLHRVATQSDVMNRACYSSKQIAINLYKYGECTATVPLCAPMEFMAPTFSYLDSADGLHPGALFHNRSSIPTYSSDIRNSGMMYDERKKETCWIYIIKSHGFYDVSVQQQQKPSTNKIHLCECSLF